MRDKWQASAPFRNQCWGEINEILQVLGMVNSREKTLFIVRIYMPNQLFRLPPQLWRSTFLQHTFLCRPPKLPSVFFLAGSHVPNLWANIGNWAFPTSPGDSKTVLQTLVIWTWEDMMGSQDLLVSVVIGSPPPHTYFIHKNEIKSPFQKGKFLPQFRGQKPNHGLMNHHQVQVPEKNDPPRKAAQETATFLEEHILGMWALLPETMRK